MTAPRDDTEKPNTDASCSSAGPHAWHSVRVVTALDHFLLVQDDLSNRGALQCIHLLSLCVTGPAAVAHQRGGWGSAAPRVLSVQTMGASRLMSRSAWSSVHIALNHAARDEEGRRTLWPFALSCRGSFS